MQLIRGLHGVARDRVPCVATIGNFDGVHLGHQVVLRQVAQAGEHRGLPSLAILFEPQPQEFFRRAETTRLTTLREKIPLLRNQPLNRLLCLRFDAELAAVEPEAFAERILAEQLLVRHLVIGDDFRFGRARRGDFALLRALGARLGFTVAATDTLILDGARVSSTRIRAALARGDLAEAAACLGRNYRISGRVIVGDRRGRTLGAPTANVALGRRALPLSGVFAVRVFGAGPVPLAGVANAGLRPTVGGTRPSLEVHLLAFEGDLYGQRIAVEFLHRLREERRFASLDELKTQIGCDIERARSWFSARDSAPGREHGERKRL